VHSAVDLLDRHAQQTLHPLAAEARYTELILHPGDMLFIPRWWWHYVTAVAAPIAREWECEYNKCCEDRDKMNWMEGGVDSGEGKCDDDGICINDCYSMSINFWWGDRRIKPTTQK
jgi:hypothetical protein